MGYSTIAEALASEGLTKPDAKVGDVIVTSMVEYNVYGHGYVPFYKAPDDDKCDIGIGDTDYATAEEAMQCRRDLKLEQRGWTLELHQPSYGIGTTVVYPGNSAMAQLLRDSNAANEARREWESK